MKNSIKQLQKQNFLDIANKINIIKTDISNPLGGILKYNEVTNINTNFFPENISTVTQTEIDNAQLFLRSYLQQYKRLLIEVKQNQFLNDVQKKLFIGSITTYGLKILGLQNAVYIEGEKGGYKLNQKDKLQYLKNIERIEQLVYGPEISKNIEEVSAIIQSLEKLFSSNKELITEEEQIIFQNFLSKHPHNTPQNINKHNIEKKTLAGKISQENFAKIFQKGLGLYGISTTITKIHDTITIVEYRDGILYLPKLNPNTQKSRTKEELEDVYQKYGIDSKGFMIHIQKCAAIAVNKNSIDIPNSTNYYSLTRSLELLSHEVITHTISGYNKQKFFPIESDSYLETQEGVAMLNEKSVSQTTSNIATEPTIHHISTFIAENYDANKTQQLLQIYYKLNKKKNATTMAKNRTERVKRFHALDLPGANRKDVVYWRGMLDVLSYIQNLDSNNIEDMKDLQKKIFGFYLGKLGKNEIGYASELIDGFGITPDTLILPADLGKILFLLLDKDNNPTKTAKINNETIAKDDIRFKASLPEHNLSYTQKKLLIQMRDFIKNSTEIDTK